MSGSAPESSLAPAVRRVGPHLVLPGLASVHSHAFQRALRGRTQRRSTAARSFWSWRGLMFALAAQLSPDELLDIARFAYIELALSGVTAVGEFHYLHHDQGGRPYANRLELAEAQIQAAREAGLRISLIRAVYLRAGYEQDVSPGQDRFCDRSVDEALADIDALRSRYAGDPLVRIAVAAHSIRAVPLPDVAALASYARGAALPFHMHLAEQRRELEECEQEYGRRPVALLAEHNLISEHLVAIHATHLDGAEIRALGAARAFVGICRSTERDLGDGFPRADALVEAGARLCVGVDSHAAPDAFDEVRAVELDARAAGERRHVVGEAPMLLEAATSTGYEAIGFAREWAEDTVALAADDPALADAEDELLAEAVIFAATPRAVREVRVAGRPVVEQGAHQGYAAAQARFRATMARLRGRLSSNL
jgi:formimidoylglutamate deiminase